MKAQGIGTLLIICYLTLFSCSSCAEQNLQYDAHNDVPAVCSDGSLLQDFWVFNKNLVSINTIKIMGSFAPIYGAARAMDSKIHACFYCPRHHKNKRQLPKGLYNTVHYGIGVVMVGLASLGLWAHDDHLRRTAQLYAVTLPYTWLIKDLLKTIKTDACLRPKNQWFSKHKRYYGGCPSGHLMEITYTAVLFGTQMGPKFGVPLGIFTGAIAVDFLNCNRHLLSQIVAGVGLGVIFAVAANKALSASDRIVWSVIPQKDCMSIRAEYRF